MSDQAFDTIIIGAGIMGSALAMELATAGRSTLLIDAVGVCAGSSARSAGGVRHQFGNAVNIELARRTIARVERFAEEFGGSCDFRQVGYMFLASKEATRDVFVSAVEQQRSMGIDSRFISPDDVAELVPGIRTDDLLGASFCARDGFLDPNTLTAAFASTAKARGAVIKTASPVTAIESSSGRATAVVTSKGERFLGDVIVNAAGVWAPGIARLYGGDLPIKSWRSQAFTIHDTPDLGQRMPMVIDFDGGKAYMHPEGPGLLVGMDNEEAAPPAWEPHLDWEKLPDIVSALVGRLPALENARAVSGWSGFLEITPDDDPISGWTHLDNVYTAAGFSGHGISLAPALAEEVAREVQGLEPTLDLSKYRFERFAEATRHPEAFAMR